MLRRAVLSACTALAALLVLGCGAAHERPGCPPGGKVLDGVWRPARLHLLDPCRHIAGRVMTVHGEQDGDLHVKVLLDPAQRSLLAAGNRARQHGWLVVELMPRDAGHLPVPHLGDRMEATGAWVTDLPHAWNELHPVWSQALNGGRPAHSGPQFGGSPATSGPGDAASTCRGPRGERCPGYPPPRSPAGAG